MLTFKRFIKFNYQILKLIFIILRLGATCKIKL